MNFHVYYADNDWLDDELAKASVDQLDFELNFKYLKNTIHQVGVLDLVT